MTAAVIVGSDVIKVLAAIIVRYLTATHENRVRDQQARLRPSRGCVDQAFICHQLLAACHPRYRLPIVLFPGLKVEFGSVDRTALFNALQRDDVREVRESVTSVELLVT